MKKFFLVEITSDERTRWFTDDVALAGSLCILTASGLKVCTNGSEPEVGVRLIDAPTLQALTERGAIGPAIKK